MRIVRQTVDIRSRADTEADKGQARRCERSGLRGGVKWAGPVSFT